MLDWLTDWTGWTGLAVLTVLVELTGLIWLTGLILAYIDGKSEIISHWPTDSLAHWPTDSPNYKEMLSHLKKTLKAQRYHRKQCHSTMIANTYEAKFNLEVQTQEFPKTKHIHKYKCMHIYTEKIACEYYSSI